MEKAFKKALGKKRRAMTAGKWVMHATIIEHHDGELEVVWVERSRDERREARPSITSQKMLQDRIS